MCNWKQVVEEYQTFIDAIPSLVNELSWLEKKHASTIANDDLDWSKLSEDAKRIKRIFWSKMAKKTEGYDDGFYRFEESIIDLYESIIAVLDRIQFFNAEHLQVTRLRAHLCLVKSTINAFKDVRKIESLYFEQLQVVIQYCLNSDLEDYFIQEVNILYLESKIEIVRRLMNKKG